MSEDTTLTTQSAQADDKSDAGADRTERLLGWNTIAAVAGLVLAVATLAFTLWFSRVLKLQADLLAPAARMASSMDTDVNRTIAALRGYVAYGDRSFVTERRRLWRDIERNYAEFQPIADARLSEERRRGYEQFKLELRELQRVQWAIEDVAHTPGNEVALHEYHTRLAPIWKSIRTAYVLAMPAARVEIEVDPELVLQLVVFRIGFGEVDRALQAYAEQRTSTALRDYEARAALFDQGRDRLRRMLEQRKAGDSGSQFLAHYVLRESEAYGQLAERLLRAVRHQGATEAQQLFQDHALPLANQVSRRMRYIATVRASATTASARLFHVLGLAVVAGALLMGIMSASTLYVSFRVRNRVQGVLSKVKRLGQYTIEKKLGEGGMGEVYLARHAMLRRPAAIKVLRRGSRAGRRAKQRFRNEVQLTSRLTHPNTVEVFDYGSTPRGLFYYAMEYLEGATLQHVVDATGPMPSARVVHLLRQIAGSLEEAHSLGLLHRDIKPSNIMLCTRGGIPDIAKVLDFGLVRKLDDGPKEEQSEVSGRLEGTPLYIAPEAILEADGSEPRSDLYALGAVGYFLVTGRPPFEGDDVIDLLSQHLGDAPVAPSERLAGPVDPELEDIILTCLAKDPERRPLSAEALRGRLTACEAQPGWTEATSKIWWAEYGEVVRAKARAAEASAGSTVREGIAVKFGGESRDQTS